MTMRNSPSGPESVEITTLTNQTVAALAAAGDSLAQSLAVPNAKVGDVAILSSVALAGSGVVIQPLAVCNAVGVLTVELTATKAYAGAANVDFGVCLFHTGPS